MTLPKPLVSAALLAAGSFAAGSGATLAVQSPATRPVPHPDKPFAIPAGVNIYTKGEADLAWHALYLVENRRQAWVATEALDPDFLSYEDARKRLGGY